MDDYSFDSTDDSTDDYDVECDADYDTENDTENDDYVEPEVLPLETARRAFNWLVVGPHPVAIDGRQFPGLPTRLVPLDELLGLLLEEDCGQELRDAVWVHLVERSRLEGATWTVACVGMAMPALALTAKRLCARWADDPRDVNASVLIGFLDGLSHVDLNKPQVLVRLRWCAYRAGHVFIRESLDLPLPSDTDFHSQEPTRPWGHPDLVLARAVADDVLTVDEANLIGSTRLEEDYSLEAAARDRLLRTDHVQVLRRRAEYRLAAYLDADIAYDSPQERRDREVAARVVAASTFSAATHAAQTAAAHTTEGAADTTTDAAATPGAHSLPHPSRSLSVTATGEAASEKCGGRLLETGRKSGVIQCGGSVPTQPRTTPSAPPPAQSSTTATASAAEVSR